jgi:hypothetical protein
MSSTIKIKRSNTSGNAPDTSNIVEGELALNTADGVLYSRGGNDIFEVGSNLTNADIDALVVNDSAQINGKLEVSPSTASDTISLGSTTQTGTTTLGQSTATNTINVGNAATVSGSKQTINIGDNGVAGSETEITIGSDDSASTTILQGLTQIDQLKPNFILPNGDNSITSVASSGKYMKLGVVEMQTDGQYYKARFRTYLTVDTDDRPPIETELTLRCKGIGTNPSINIHSLTDDFFEDDFTSPALYVRQENDVGGGGAGPVRFSIWMKTYAVGSGLEIFLHEQIKSDNQVSVTYESSFAESSYINSTDYFASGGSTNGTSSSDAKVHTTSSYHWDDLFGDEPGMVRTTGGRGSNSIKVVDKAGGLLHFDSGTNTYSHTYNISPSDKAPITIGSDDSASITTLQGVTKIDQLAARIKTPTGDNSVSSITTSGKLIKIATIDHTTAGQYYKLTLDTYSRVATLNANYNGEKIAPTRSVFSLHSNGVGSAAQMALQNIVTESPFDRGYHPLITVNVNNDVAGDGSGPARVELWMRIFIPTSGVESFVVSEMSSDLRGMMTWEDTFAETDYQSFTDVANISGYQLSSSSVEYTHTTKSLKWDDLFGTNAGIIKTNGGNSTTDISAVSSSHGFLHYDSDTETFSHTYDMLPSDPATSITIGDSAQTNTISLGTSKVQQAVSINAGVGTTSGSIKQTNISTGQTNGSCDTNIGPTSSSVTSLVDILGTVNIAGNRNSDTITIGSTSQVGAITIGRSLANNDINIGTGAMDGLVAQTINIGNNKSSGSSVIGIGNNVGSGLTQISIGKTLNMDANNGGTWIKLYSDAEFHNNVTIDSDLSVEGTINGKYDTVITSGSNMTATDFLANSGKKIIHTQSSDFTIQDFQPVAADVGKHWTIMNASTSSPQDYVKLVFGTQFVRLMSGTTQYATEDTWRIGRAGVAELVCVNSVANGGSITAPNFILYGNNLDTQ